MVAAAEADRTGIVAKQLQGLTLIAPLTKQIGRVISKLRRHYVVFSDRCLKTTVVLETRGPSASISPATGVTLTGLEIRQADAVAPVLARFLHLPRSS